MALSLTRTRENASQASDGTYNLDGVPTIDSTRQFLSVKDGLGLANGAEEIDDVVAEGLEGIFMVQRNDVGSGADWCVIVGRYVGTQLVRQSTKYSSASNGVDDIDFGNSASLVIFGINDGDKLNALDARVTANEDYVEKRTACGVSAYLNANKAISANVETQLTSFTEEWDFGGDFASGVFTAPFDGQFKFTGMQTYQVTSDQDRVKAVLKVEGITKFECFMPASGGAFSSIPFSKAFDLTEGDEVKIYALNSDSADTVNAGTAYTFIQIEYVGN